MLCVALGVAQRFIFAAADVLTDGEQDSDWRRSVSTAGHISVMNSTLKL
jgi:hypothetical protein